MEDDEDAGRDSGDGGAGDPVIEAGGAGTPEGTQAAEGAASPVEGIKERVAPKLEEAKEKIVPKVQGFKETLAPRVEEAGKALRPQVNKVVETLRRSFTRVKAKLTGKD